MCTSFLSGSRPCLYIFSVVVLADVVPNAVNIKKQLTPLERELEGVEGISSAELGQPVAEVLGRVSIVTPTTASRARFHPQSWGSVSSIKVGQTRSWWL